MGSMGEEAAPMAVEAPESMTLAQILLKWWGPFKTGIERSWNEKKQEHAARLQELQLEMTNLTTHFREVEADQRLKQQELAALQTQLNEATETNTRLNSQLENFAQQNGSVLAKNVLEENEAKDKKILELQQQENATREEMNKLMLQIKDLEFEVDTQSKNVIQVNEQLLNMQDKQAQEQRDFLVNFYADAINFIGSTFGGYASVPLSMFNNMVGKDEFFYTEKGTALFKKVIVDFIRVDLPTHFREIRAQYAVARVADNVLYTLYQVGLKRMLFEFIKNDMSVVLPYLSAYIYIMLDAPLVEAAPMDVMVRLASILMRFANNNNISTLRDIGVYWQATIKQYLRDLFAQAQANEPNSDDVFQNAADLYRGVMDLNLNPEVFLNGLAAQEARLELEQATARRDRELGPLQQQAKAAQEALQNARARENVTQNELRLMVETANMAQKRYDNASIINNAIIDRIRQRVNTYMPLIEEFDQVYANLNRLLEQGQARMFGLPADMPLPGSADGYMDEEESA